MKKSFTIKRVLIRIFSYILPILLIPWINLLILTAVYALPTGTVTFHVQEGLELLAEEGPYPKMPYLRGTAILDNFTDNIMLDTCLSYDEPSLSSMWNALFSRGYHRYWHGYVVFLKPLLYFFEYKQIRILISGIHLALFLTVFLLLYKRFGLRLAIPFAISWYALSSMLVTTSLQFTACYFLIFLGMIAICLFYKKTTGYF